MNCPHCSSPDTKRFPRVTVLGYQIFHCRHCQRKFNERTGTPFNFLEYPTDIVLLVVLWRLRYRLTLRIWLRCSWSGVSSLLMKQSENVKNALHLWSRGSYEPEGEGRLALPGMWTRLTSKWRATGAIYTGPLTVMATWWIVC